MALEDVLDNVEEFANRKKRQYGDDPLQSLGAGNAFVESGGIQAPQGEAALAFLPIGVVAEGPAVAPLRDCGVKDLVSKACCFDRGLI